MMKSADVSTSFVSPGVVVRRGLHFLPVCVCVCVFFFLGKGRGGTPHMHGHKESYTDLNLKILTSEWDSNPRPHEY